MFEPQKESMYNIEVDCRDTIQIDVKIVLYVWVWEVLILYSCQDIGSSD